MIARGGWLILLLMFGFTVYDLSRPFLPGGERPALSIYPQEKFTIQLAGTGGYIDGIHQINDAFEMVDVIKLTGLKIAEGFNLELLASEELFDGKCIIFQSVMGEIQGFESGWMPAAMRMAIGIPLRVERMTKSDWEDLPGIGPALALRIETYRHKNGGIHSFVDLKKVGGIGVKGLNRWREYFHAVQVGENIQKNVRQ